MKNHRKQGHLLNIDKEFNFTMLNTTQIYIVKGKYKLVLYGTTCLKGPKHEIFESGFFTEIRPVRIGDLGTGEKK
jgi:hypothetical protein